MDGTVKGILQETGVYVWMLDYIDPSGKINIIKKGYYFDKVSIFNTGSFEIKL